MRTIAEINEKIASGKANVFTADEFKQAIRDGNPPSFDEVDVVTCGTCGIMSGTAAIFNVVVAEGGVFKRAKSITLNGVPANVGPCPNEWLGSVDLILHGTSKDPNNPQYGGGFLLNDIVSGKEITLKVETIDGDIIESTTTLEEMGKAQIIGSRMAFKNYTAFLNPSNEAVSSIFCGIPLEGNYEGLTFSGCGDLNPLQNNPNIQPGTSILLNGAKGFVLSNGTKSTPEKPNLMLTGDLKDMDAGYLGGFKTGEGAEVFDTVAIPIPVLNEEIYNNLLITNDKIPLTVADIKGRHLPITETTYALWDNTEARPRINSTKCSKCDTCSVEDICPTNAFKDKRLDITKCFGCGLCVHYCKKSSCKMEIGSIDIDNHNVPIICRQSDRLRANKLANKLKKMILNEEFKI